ncbi:uncharacterized protein LOC111083269 [Limulus polyphemus]|uniref:Uncharacterized protein LOC111083269 n=1 Tax=Limulus polyphemus TaxID=6850 RepID=A0ABM1RVF3_LIMPO|nr:uncharacterized protein LOC111083269 [Limulus polyphemus]
MNEEDYLTPHPPEDAPSLDELCKTPANEKNSSACITCFLELDSPIENTNFVRDYRNCVQKFFVAEYLECFEPLKDIQELLPQEISPKLRRVNNCITKKFKGHKVSLGLPDTKNPRAHQTGGIR